MMSQFHEIGWLESNFDSDMNLQTVEDDMQEIVFSRCRRGSIVKAN